MRFSAYWLSPFLSAIVAALSLGQASPAHADTPGKSLAVGAAVVVKPKYEGSADHDVFAIPLVIPKFPETSDEPASGFRKFRKRIKFRGLDDVRLRGFNAGAFEFGLVSGYLTDRDEDDGERLGGLGDIDGGLSLGGYAALNVGNVTFDIAAFDKVSGDDAGVQVRLGAETERRVSERVKIVARLGATIADDDYMQTYFGVTPSQAAASSFGLPAFSAGSGVKDVHVELGAEVMMSERWLVKAGGRYGRLLGDAADSPLVETEDQLSATLGVGYLFNLGR